MKYDIVQFGVSIVGRESDLAGRFRLINQWDLKDVDRVGVRAWELDEALVSIDPLLKAAGNLSWSYVADGRSEQALSQRGIRVTSCQEMKIPFFERLWMKDWGGDRFKRRFWVWRCLEAHELFQFVWDDLNWTEEGAFLLGLDQAIGEDDSVIARVAKGPRLCYECLSSGAAKVLVLPMGDGCGFDVYWHRKHCPIERIVIEELAAE